MENKSPGSDGSNLDYRYGTITLVASSLAIFFTSFMTSGINLAIPEIGSEFRADAVLLSWVVNSFFLAVSMFLVPFGRIADIFGLKRIFLLGIGLFTIIAAVTLLSNSVVMLIVLRALHGISCAMVFSTGTALVTATHGIQNRGRALGIGTASVYVGYSAGPFLGGLLTEYFGWRSLFAVIIPVGVIVISLVLWKIRGEWRPSQGEHFDTKGSIIYGISLVFLIYGLSLLPEITGAVITGIGILGILSFLKLETKTQSPVLNLGIFKNNRTYLFSNLATFISYVAISAIIYLMSLYLQYIQALTAEQAGLILLAQPIMLVIGSPITGRLSDKVEPRIVSSAGMTLILAGLILLTFLSLHSSIGYVIFSLVVVGLGMAIFISPNNNAVMSSVSARYYGIAAATLGTMRSIGQMISIGIVTVVISTTIGRVEIAPVYYPAFVTSTQICFGISSAFCLVGILIS